MNQQDSLNLNIDTNFDSSIGSNDNPDSLVKDFSFEKFVKMIISNKYEEYTLMNFGDLVYHYKEDFLVYNPKDEKYNLGIIDYKYRNLYSFYDNLISVNELKDYIMLNPEKMFWIFHIIIKIDKSQYILQKLDVKNILKNAGSLLISNLYFEVSLLSNLPTFIIFDNLIEDVNKKYLFSGKKSILSGSARNSDLRVLKYILDNINNYTSDELLSKPSIGQVISSCFKITSKQKGKHAFKRLRLINERIKLQPYFEVMIDSVDSLESLLKLDKYYGDSKNFDDDSYQKLFRLLYNSTNFSWDPENITNASNKITSEIVKSVINIFPKASCRSKMILTIFSNRFDFKFDYQNVISNVPRNFLIKILNDIITSLIDQGKIIYNNFVNVKVLLNSNSFLSYNLNNVFKFIGKDLVTDIFNRYLISYFSIKQQRIDIEPIIYLFPFVNYFETSDISILWGLKEDLKKEVSKLDSHSDIPSSSSLKIITSLEKRIKNFHLGISKNFIFLNKLRVEMKIYIKKFIKIRNLQKKINHMDLLNEIKYFKPNKKFDVLKNGSRLYKIESQKFNNVPPRHLLFGELENIKNKEIIVREKADGYLIDYLPYDVEPRIEKIKLFDSPDSDQTSDMFKSIDNIQIKSEFIEELDLYLVFDIDLPDDFYSQGLDVCCIEERYNYLRNMHHLTKGILLNNKPIDSFELLEKEVKEEAVRFKKFLSEPYDSYRFYPKASWKILLDDKMKKELNDKFIFHSSHYFCDENNPNSYEKISGLDYDGLILSPLDNKRELKIKPLSKHTIDLLYIKSENKFIDREKNNWNSFIDLGSILNKKIENYSICRLNPVIGDIKQAECNDLIFKFESIRYDKKRPNTNKVVNQIINFIKCSLKKCKIEFPCYYPEVDNRTFNYKSNVWKDIIEKQKNYLSIYLKKLLPEKNLYWLDLGCGSGKLLKFIKKYNYNGYLGIDSDINQLLMAINRIDNKIINSDIKGKKLETQSYNKSYFIDKERLVLGNLKESFGRSDFFWDNLNDNNILIKNKFDYVVCNFSVCHFVGESFWENLNFLVKKGTKMIFNCINSKIKVQDWTLEDDDSVYMKYDNNSDNPIVKIKFPHIDYIEESYLSKERIKYYTKNSGWIINNVYTPDGDDICSFYDWYLIVKD